jgi:cyclase
MPKKILLLLCLQLISFYLFATPSYYNYEAIKITDEIYVLKPRLAKGRWTTSNITLIATNEGILVIDSGILPSAATEAIVLIKKLFNQPVKYLINTHWHGDHWHGNATFKKEYPQLQIITSNDAYEEIATRGLKDLQPDGFQKAFTQHINEKERFIRTGEYTDGQKATPEQIKEATELLPLIKWELEELGKIEPLLPSITFEKSLNFKNGGKEIRLLHLGLGNTKGDVVIYLPQDSILITGDLVVYPSPYESGSFSQSWLNVLKQLNDFPVNTIIPGHGIVFKDKEYIKYLSSLFEKILQAAAKWKKEGLSFEEMKTQSNFQYIKDLVSQNPAHQKMASQLQYYFFTAALTTLSKNDTF